MKTLKLIPLFFIFPSTSLHACAQWYIGFYDEEGTWITQTSQGYGSQDECLDTIKSEVSRDAVKDFTCKAMDKYYPEIPAD